MLSIALTRHTTRAFSFCRPRSPDSGTPNQRGSLPSKPTNKRHKPMRHVHQIPRLAGASRQRHGHGKRRTCARRSIWSCCGHDGRTQADVNAVNSRAATCAARPNMFHPQHDSACKMHQCGHPCPTTAAPPPASTVATLRNSRHASAPLGHRVMPHARQTQRHSSTPRWGCVAPIDARSLRQHA